jgi:hypothetical protein
MPDNERSLDELLASLCDETISAEEMRRLDRLICTDAAARRLYMEYLDLHARLSYRFHQSAESAFPLACESEGIAAPEELSVAGASLPLVVETPSAVPISTFAVQDFPSLSSPVSPFLSPWGSFAISYSLAAVIVGLGLLMGWVCQVSSTQQIVQNNPRRGMTPAPLVPDLVFVGRVTGMVDCHWADSRTGTVTYAYVPKGRKYALASGLMEITYDTGAKVILQGPCTYVVESERGGFLSGGKVTALVEKKKDKRREPKDSMLHAQPSAVAKSIPPSVPLFAVRTPTASVADFGTEFGVSVDERGMTGSHVFHGKVVLTALDRGEKQNPGIILAANESARIERRPGSLALVVRRQAIDPAGFVSSERFALKIKEIGELPLKPFRDWRDTSEKLLRNRKDLLAYYDFQRDHNHPRDENGYELLQNRAATGHGFDGRVMGAIRMGMAQGRFPGKDALKFTYPGDGVHINIPGKFSRLTLMASIALDRCDYYSGILMTDQWERPGQLHWQFDRDGIIQFSFPDIGNYRFTASEAADFAGWHVWSIVLDMSNKRVTTYVDGRRLNESILPKEYALTIGEATIGNWAPWEGSSARPLFGRMDEFAIFDRALGDAEIKALYETGGWKAAALKSNGTARKGSMEIGSRP